MISKCLIFRKTDFFLEDSCQPTILIYFKELNFEVSTELAHNCKSY